MTQAFYRESLATKLNLGVIERSWESWMGIRSSTIVKGGREGNEGPMLIISSKAQASWTIP